MLLIHADPGARSGFIAAWLTNKLSKLAFDSGVGLLPIYHKIHNLDDVGTLKNHLGIKIRVKPSIATIDLHSLLFLRKNVHVQLPDFTRNEYSLETFTKLHHFSKEILEWDHELDYDLYDVVINFADTFDNNFMINLYVSVNGVDPSPEICFEQEQALDLKEEHRFWSIVDVYNTTSVDQLYDTVLQSIVPSNYGIFL
jgi:hypothetical protein